MTESPKPAEPTIATFRPRLIAFLIDLGLLAAVCWVLTQFFFTFVASLGNYGRLLGIALAVVYFGLWESYLGRGQTLGKRLTRIKTAGADGTLLGLERAVLRAVLFFSPFWLHGMALAWVDDYGQIVSAILGSVFTAGSVGMAVVLIYFFLFNQKTDQSIHDLLTGAYVLKAKADVAEPARMASIHAKVAPVLGVLAALAFGSAVYYGEMVLLPAAAQSPLLADLRAQPNVIGVYVRVVNEAEEDEKPLQVLHVDLRLDRQPTDWKPVLDEVARLALKRLAPSDPVTEMQVQADCLADLLFYRVQSASSARLSIADWRKRLGQG